MGQLVVRSDILAQLVVGDDAGVLQSSAMLIDFSFCNTQRTHQVLV